MNIGDYIETPRFLRVRIAEVFETKSAAREQGFTEPTHYINDEWEILGKSLDMYHMIFAAAKR